MNLGMSVASLFVPVLLAFALIAWLAASILRARPSNLLVGAGFLSSLTIASVLKWWLFDQSGGPSGGQQFWIVLGSAVVGVLLVFAVHRETATQTTHNPEPDSSKPHRAATSSGVPLDLRSIAIGGVLVAGGYIAGMFSGTPRDFSACVARASVEATSADLAFAKARLCYAAFPSPASPVATTPAASAAPITSTDTGGSEGRLKPDGTVDFRDPATGRVYALTPEEYQQVTGKLATH